MKNITYRGILAPNSRPMYGGCSACGTSRPQASTAQFLTEYNMMFEGKQFSFQIGQTYKVADNLAEFLLTKYSYRQGVKIPAFIEEGTGVSRDEGTGIPVADKKDSPWKTVLPKYHKVEGNKEMLLQSDNTWAESTPEREEELNNAAKAISQGELEINKDGLFYLSGHPEITEANDPDLKLYNIIKQNSAEAIYV